MPFEFVGNAALLNLLKDVVLRNAVRRMASSLDDPGALHFEPTTVNIEWHWSFGVSGGYRSTHIVQSLDSRVWRSTASNDANSREKGENSKIKSARLKNFSWTEKIANRNLRQNRPDA